jgi:large subunit ribosomal protein L21
MKYAIVEVSGRQFWVERGQYYDINKIPTSINQKIILNRVLLLNNGSQISLGNPYLKTVTVSATIIKHLRGRKTIVYKMRPKKKTRKKQGHRQELTRVFIENINMT